MRVNRAISENRNNNSSNQNEVRQFSGTPSTTRKTISPNRTNTKQHSFHSNNSQNITTPLWCLNEPSYTSQNIYPSEQPDDLDIEFDQYCLDIVQQIPQLASKHDRIRGIEWINKLREVTANRNWKINRNNYARLLHAMVLNLEPLSSPFNTAPPEGYILTLSLIDYPRAKKIDPSATQANKMKSQLLRQLQKQQSQQQQLLIQQQKNQLTINQKSYAQQIHCCNQRITPVKTQQLQLTQCASLRLQGSPLNAVRVWQANSGNNFNTNNGMLQFPSAPSTPSRMHLPIQTSIKQQSKQKLDSTPATSSTISFPLNNSNNCTTHNISAFQRNPFGSSFPSSAVSLPSTPLSSNTLLMKQKSTHKQCDCHCHCSCTQQQKQYVTSPVGTQHRLSNNDDQYNHYQQQRILLGQGQQQCLFAPQFSQQNNYSNNKLSSTSPQNASNAWKGNSSNCLACCHNQQCEKQQEQCANVQETQQNQQYQQQNCFFNCTDNQLNQQNQLRLGCSLCSNQQFQQLLQQQKYQGNCYETGDSNSRRKQHQIPVGMVQMPQQQWQGHQQQYSQQYVSSFEQLPDKHNSNLQAYPCRDTSYINNQNQYASHQEEPSFQAAQQQQEITYSAKQLSSQKSQQQVNEQGNFQDQDEQQITESNRAVVRQVKVPQFGYGNRITEFLSQNKEKFNNNVSDNYYENALLVSQSHDHEGNTQQEKDKYNVALEYSSRNYSQSDDNLQGEEQQYPEEEVDQYQQNNNNNNNNTSTYLSSVVPSNCSPKHSNNTYHSQSMQDSTQGSYIPGSNSINNQINQFYHSETIQAFNPTQNIHKVNQQEIYQQNSTAGDIEKSANTLYDKPSQNKYLKQNQLVHDRRCNDDCNQMPLEDRRMIQLKEVERTQQYQKKDSSIKKIKGRDIKSGVNVDNRVFSERKIGSKVSTDRGYLSDSLENSKVVSLQEQSDVLDTLSITSSGIRKPSIKLFVRQNQHGSQQENDKVINNQSDYVDEDDDSDDKISQSNKSYQQGYYLNKGQLLQSNENNKILNFSERLGDIQGKTDQFIERFSQYSEVLQRAKRFLSERKSIQESKDTPNQSDHDEIVATKANLQQKQSFQPMQKISTDGSYQAEKYENVDDEQQQFHQQIVISQSNRNHLKKKNDNVNSAKNKHLEIDQNYKQQAEIIRQKLSHTKNGTSEFLTYLSRIHNKIQ